MLRKCRRTLQVGKPYDPFKIAEVFGIELKLCSSANPCGRLYHRGPEWTILVPASMPLSRQRFACAHELGHFFVRSLENNDIIHELLRVKEKHDFRVAEEIFCDIFAEELLLPAEDIGPHLRENRLHLHGFRQLIAEYGCSLQTTAIRITQFAHDYAFLFATLERQRSRKNVLIVRWTATPPGTFLPKHKTISFASVIGKAFVSKQDISETEDKPLGSLRGSYYVEAMPVGRSVGAFALIQLSSSYQLHFAFPPGWGLTSERTHPRQLSFWDTMTSVNY